MSLRFIIGRAGSGKTRTCLEEIATALRQSSTGKALIFLVPEQATFQTESALCSMPGIEGVLRAHVLSFRRLAHHVLNEVGGEANPRIGDLGKRMLLGRFLDARRTELQAFKRIRAVPGFLDRVAATISEFKTYLVTPRMLQDAALRIEQSGEHRLAEKVSDLALLYSALEDYLADHYTDPDDYLELLAEKIPCSSLVKDCEIWVDGFSGFTPQEYKVLEALLFHARRVNVALCLDSTEEPGASTIVDVFQVTRVTYNKLLQMASRNGVGVEPQLEMAAEPPPRFASAPALAHVESSFCRYSDEPFPNDPTGITVVAAADRQAEIEAVAREIIHLCRERGYRFRDISIVTRQLELYRDFIAEVFSDFAIPFFVDSKRSVMHHPVVELIRSALDTVISEWAYDPVFRYLKTDLVPVDRESVDLLENYVLEFGISGSRWTDDREWAFRPKRLDDMTTEPTAAERANLERINSIRRRAVGELASFEKAIRDAIDVAAATRCLVELLIRLDVPGKLDAWSEQAREEGNPDLAREYAQLWNGLMSLFDELVESLGSETLTLPEYARVLEAGLDGLRLALIPPALDQVLVSSLERSRNPNVRAAFVIGANDGVFPALRRDAGLLSDQERERLAAGGLELAPGVRQRHLEEQFLVYIGLTRPSEYLWVSYALADEDGSALNPSVIVERLKSLFPHLQERMFGADPGHLPGDELHYVAHPETVVSYLATSLRRFVGGEEIDPIWWDVYNHILTTPGAASGARSALKSLFFQNADAALSSELTLSIYGNPVHTSVSRIELINACPFAHFCKYGLRLQERRVYEVGPPDIGEFIHAALKVFVDRVTSEAGDWTKLDDGECVRMADEVVRELTPALQNEILLSTGRHRHLASKVQKTVARAALVMTEHARRGSFRPHSMEVPFGPEERLIPPPFTVKGREIQLVGRIDRVDMVERGGKHYLRVIDYKSGRAELDLSSMFHGLQIQLPVYLDVALTCAPQLIGAEAEPAGMLYFRVRNPFVRAEAPLGRSDVEERLMESLKMTGLVVADQDVIQLMDRDIGPGKKSSVIPVSVTKKGTFSTFSCVFTSEQIDVLRGHLRRLIRRAGQMIVNGTVDILPSVLGNYHACRYCAFRPVCQFDPLVAGNQLKYLTKYARDDVWKRIVSGKEDG